MKQVLHLCSPKQWEHYGDFLIRITVGLIFTIAGFGKLFGGIEMFSGMLNGLGIPLPLFMAYLVAIIELVGGIMILLGLWTMVPSILLVVVMLVAIITVHNGVNSGSFWNEAKYPLLLLVATLRYVGTPGYLAITTYLKKKRA